MNLPEDLLKDMSDIEYGWVSKDKTRYENKIIRKLFEKDYFLQSPKELKQNKLGVCWDQVEYERSHFEKMNFPFKTIFMIYDTGIMKHMHTFLVYKDKKDYCWFENTYPNFIGINRYHNMQELIKDVMKDFLKENHLMIIGENIKFYTYEKPEYNISCEDFVNHCQKGMLLESDYSNLGI